MAPRASRRGGSVAGPEAIYELGVQGRQTGISLRDGGERDANGMQPLEGIFSSPESAPRPASASGDSGSEDMDIASSGGPGPQTVLKGRRSVQHPIPRSRSPLKTHLKSPARKNPHVQRLSSPIRGAVLQDEDEDEEPEDVDEEPERDATVTRKINFSSKNGTRPTAPRAKTVNGTRRSSQRSARSDEAEEEVPYISNDDLRDQSLQLIDGLDAAEQANGAFSHDEDDEPPMRQDAPWKKRSAPAKAKARAKAVLAASPGDDQERGANGPAARGRNHVQDDQSASATKRKRGRPPKAKPEANPPKAAAPTATKTAPQPENPGRGRRKQKQLEEIQEEPVQEEEEEEEEEQVEEPVEEEVEEQMDEPDEEEADEDIPRAKRPRTEAPPTATKPGRGRPPKIAKAEAKAVAKPSAASKTKPTAKKAAKAAKAAEPAEEAGEASFMALQRGPPMPKSRGLVSVRREAGEMSQTRSGRHSYRPVHYWRGEEVVREDEAQHDLFHRGNDFLLPSIKEIVRVAPEERAAAKRASRPGGKARGRPKSQSKQQRLRLADYEQDEEPEAWELNPGTVAGEVVLWEPEHEMHPPADDEPVQITEEQIALSADAVQTTDIRDATFRFAKTLTMPFMGAGVVDLPPGAEKRPKNSRKMHMVFFVHYGKVLVSVNETQFRISAGGMWFVPRGNYYSINNDYDSPCRIFFSQGCEVAALRDDPVNPDASQSIMN
ncbi:hypothetical protein S40293_09097 [Stachybotrys chartarum IBT 40293]|nr:hypothetical protein S40293_09097 [Stachybotrys chartarum IBT 40293]